MEPKETSSKLTPNKNVNKLIDKIDVDSRMNVIITKFHNNFLSVKPISGSTNVY